MSNDNDTAEDESTAHAEAVLAMDEPTVPWAEAVDALENGTVDMY